MLLYARPLFFLKRPVLVLLISALAVVTGMTIPRFDTMAEVQQVPALPTSTSEEATYLLSADQLQELVGPIALYPDELIAIVLPASTYPLEIVQAARFMEKRKTQPDLKPDEKWDPSVLGLLNYPEVIDLMNSDLDWTWKLGEAVINQQQDVMDAIQQFRNTAHTAGNLESNDKQIIVVEKEIIKIESATPEVIYVPTYNPQTVIVHQPVPYVYYYSAPYPYYYNPAAVFWTGMFIGAAFGYSIGWGGWGHNDIHYKYTTNINVGGDKWKPGGGNRPGYRPGNRPGYRPGVGNRPGYKPGDRPGDRPGAGQRPSTGQRPSAGQRPSTGQRPSAGQRPSTGQRPSAGQRPSIGQQPSHTRTGNAGSFGGYNRGQDTYRNSQRGHQFYGLRYHHHLMN